ncbi:pyruvate dehydrogenase E2 component (dihydrolipoamide acetyltransferase) [Nonlabens dokdonensis]|uniref:Acetyltransferase component of pyruvate dehydrogenase complex n=2 Tax=Nonlabens dokdonensis TaxID=328515 RepID=L7WE10_NONDD|nr:pyruvate dehydrogenase complex dihydrolipoamide acetyltransferase [Nonlabens dokdonensis]AGC77143.1 dihydrolipoyllysine-residue acetyltransferase [Nonlabens dokdonensis DSW-6]PZX41102.1 pyruvate dehydrogenase E2 component (dihydrolipoamide acetyltransferase) [Nonlabens dokdonensis]
MAEVVNMPRLSDTMEEGVVAAWLKQVGDKVEEGDILAEIETDKATMEFESFQEGTLLHIGVQEGETAPVDQLLCIIGEEGEDISVLLEGDASSDKKEEKASKEESSSNDDKDSSNDSDDNSDSGSNSSSSDLPEGVVIVNMPRLSDTMEEGTVASWLKKEGDEVEEGDILAEIETDKATMEFESFNAGTLLKIGIQEGETAKVDSLLAIIGPAGTDVSGISMDADTTPKKEPKKVEKKEEPKKEAPKAETKSEPKASTSSTSSSSASSSNSNGGRIFASPLAKKMAEEKGINLSQISGSGENGRIVKSDIENFTPSAAGASAAPSSFVAVGTETFEEVPNSQMRKTIAKRLGESKFTAPHYYLGLDLDMDNAIASRKAINELPDTKISFNDMVIKAAAMALRKHPKVNTQWTDKNTIIAKHIHVGVAVAVDDGLLVPVLPFADQMSMQQIGAKVKELASKARNKKLQPDEMQGSTFTISNLGMFGITEFTSIINQPNSAIMSVGAIVQKPVVKDGQIVVGNVMKITLACDHRTVDGATGAAFLQTFKSYIENPIVMYV